MEESTVDMSGYDELVTIDGKGNTRRLGDGNLNKDRRFNQEQRQVWVKLNPTKQYNRRQRRYLSRRGA